MQGEINIERAGSGILNMYYVWKKQRWYAPIITEFFNPDRITLTLLLGKISGKQAAIKITVHKK